MAAYSNRVVEFGGGNEYITAGNVLGFERTDTQSWSFWAQWGAAAYGMFLAKSAVGDTGFYIYHTPTGNFSVVLQGSSGGYIQKTSTISGLNDGQWRHYAVTYDGSSLVDGIKIYADDVDVTAAGGVNTLASSIVITDPFTLGRYGGASYFFAGRMDEVAVYSGTLTPTEVSWIFNGKIPRSLNDVGAPTGRRVWWRMGESATYPTIPDEGGSFPGTMVNMESGDILTDQIVGYGGCGFMLPLASAKQGGLPGVGFGIGEGGGGPVVQVKYKMRAQDAGAAPPGYVTWVADDAPDFAGVGYPGGSPTPVGAMVVGSAVVVARYEVVP